jgi:hypothetical protein
MNKLSVKQLRAKVKEHQKKICPSYSKMKKQELLDYLENVEPGSVKHESDVVIHKKKKGSKIKVDDEVTINKNVDPQDADTDDDESTEIQLTSDNSKPDVNKDYPGWIKKNKSEWLQKKSKKSKKSKKFSSDDNSYDKQGSIYKEMTGMKSKKTKKVKREPRKKRTAKKRTAKKEPTKWMKHVKAYYNDRKKKEPDYKYKDAMTDAKPSYTK